MADKKQKVEIVSATAFAKNVKKRWVVYLASFVGVMFVFFLFQSSGNAPMPKKENKVAFVDSTPENSNQRQVLSDIQLKLSSIEKASAAERAEAKSREEALAKEVADLKASQAKEVDRALEEYKKKLDAELAKKEEDSKTISKLGDGGILIPTGNGKTPPPPPIYVPDSERNAQTPRANLPANNIQGGSVTRTPMVITGSTDNPDNVIAGSEPVVEEKAKRGQGTYLPAGSFARVTLITGADFGAGRQTQSNPQPSLMRLQSDATLPGMAFYKLKDCFAIANGYGELSSERAYMQVSRLSCIQERTGKVMETSILGYIADSDGKLGMRGVVQRRSGMLLGKALLAGFADGAAKIMTTTAQNAQQVITGSGVVSTVDPDTAGRAALWAGASSAMSKLADQYIKDADSIFPVIEVDAGRNATMIIQQGQELAWMEPKKEEKK